MRIHLALLACSFVVMELPARAANKTVCVQVMVRGPETERPPAPPPPPPSPAAPGEPKPIPELDSMPPAPPPPRQGDANVPVGQDPVSYLKRLIEHFVSHERGFAAVPSGCEERIDVELYPLREGWMTVFARYSGTGREERVDYLLSDELSQFAERVVTALLYDRPISTTILRDTVLRADSKKAQQRIRGTNHFEIGLAAPLRLGITVPRAQSDGSAADQAAGFWPFELSLGYRGKFEAWGLEARFGLVIAPDKTGLSQNSGGGAIDYGGNINFTLHFLRYLNPRGLSSWYLGAGGAFEVLWFYQIDQGGPNGSRSTLASGGFSFELISGIEFMRASKAQFFLQAALILPAYAVEIGDHAQHMNTWFPGASLMLGMLF
jgi:hypothetical protein